MFIIKNQYFNYFKVGVNTCQSQKTKESQRDTVNEYMLRIGKPKVFFNPGHGKIFYHAIFYVTVVFFLLTNNIYTYPYNLLFIIRNVSENFHLIPLH
jgi:hypothetical protein